ncbi:hypothetical protein J7K18_06180 [bacterium]|nr:hypothetical protein [bacterium]
MENYEGIRLIFQCRAFWLIILLFFASVGFAYLSYRITNPPVPQKKKKLLVILRSLAFFFLFLSISEPVLFGIKQWRKRPKLIILVDNSKSLGITDRICDRAETVRALLESKPIKELKSRYPTETLLFSGDIDTTSPSPDFTGDVTAIGNAILSLSQMEDIGGVILITDGETNSGEDPVFAASYFPKKIYTIGVGDPEPTRDIFIKDVQTNRTAYRNTPFTVRVIFQASGFEKGKARVQILSGKKVLAGKEVEISKGTRIYSENLSVSLDTVGTVDLTARIPTLTGEFTGKNNRKRFSINILKSKRKLMLLVGRLNYEYRFFREALGKNKNIEIKEEIVKKGYRISSFPRTVDRMKEYEAIFLFNAVETLSKNNLLKKLLNYIRSGGSVFMLIQNASRLPETDRNILAEILPFEYPANTEMVSESFSPLPTIEGKKHTLMQFEEPADRVFSGLPPLEEFLMAGEIKPYAIPLLVHPELKDIPVYSIGTVGRGKVAVFSAYPLWKWSFLAKGFHKFEDCYDQLVQNLLAWLLVKEKVSPLVVRTDKRIYHSGESILFSATVSDESGKPVEAASVGVKLFGKDTVEITLDEIGKGQYEKVIPSLPPGEYRFNAAAKLNFDTIGKANGKLIVEEYSLEFEDTRMNRPALISVAEKTGGRFFTPDEIDSLSNCVKFEDMTGTEYIEKPLWDYPVFLFLFILALSLEWFTRKRSDLL